jgi:uracil-DNA glycosylase
MHSVTLQHAADFTGFRSAARELLAAQVPPDHVSWRTVHETGHLFGEAPQDLPTAAAQSAVTVPRVFMELAAEVALHSDPTRFALLYRLLWRLRSEPRLLALAVDADVARARAMAQAVHRDIHKMHAFVRFRELPAAEPKTFIAWFEPQHHIVEAATPFFVRRFPNVPWIILTPLRSARWNLSELTFAPGGRRCDAPADDATESLWRDYYASIFNPARLKVESMRAHMPKKYWRNLPESVLIPQLIAASQERTQEMIAKPATAPARRRRNIPGPARVVVPPTQDGSLSLNEIREQAEHCRDCPLWKNATQTVFGEGPRSARIVLVGEQPGDQEDIAGKPFVGPAGRLLDRALQEAGVDRKLTYVTNAVKHFKFEPRGKRRLHKTPSQLEVAACHQWLERELAAIEPDLIVAMGATAARAVFGRPTAIQKNRGHIIEAQSESSGHQADILVTVHPSFLLRVPDQDKDAAYRAFVKDLELVVPYAKLR